jgi:hypothetical protein
MPQDSSMTMPQGDNMTQPPMDDTMQQPPVDNGQSKYDTNFDAGVEADEDTDPKKYIQQLTGKLSTTLNTFNNENDDAGLNKYVAKMIVKQATKNMADSAKKEIIKAINTSSEPDVEDDEPENNSEEPVENGQEEMNEPVEQENIQEMFLTKKQIKALQEGIKKKIKK